MEKVVKILGWDIEQAKSLLHYVLGNKKISLTAIFQEWAKSNARQTYSVRNYFYKLCKKIKEDKNLYTLLGLCENDLKELFNLGHFNTQTARELLYAILPMENQKSVRSACMRLAKGETSLMVRYQNKYRNILKNNKKEVLEVMKDLQNKGFLVRSPYKEDNKIICMPKRQKEITDTDMKALFMGLVNLIKRNAEREISQELAKEVQFSNDTLQITLIDLRRKQLMVQELQEQNKKLKNDLTLVQNNLAVSQAQNLSTILQVQNLVNSKKMKDLKEFFQQMNLQQISESVKKE